MPKLNLESIPQTNATGYPAPFDAQVQDRWYRRLGPVSGLGDFSASHVVLKAGAWSSHRHWHDGEDEMLIMIAGEAVLIEEGGRQIMRTGDIAIWPKGIANGHHLINESGADCVFVAVGGGTQQQKGGVYSDIDMVFNAEGYFRKHGTRYDVQRVP